MCMNGLVLLHAVKLVAAFATFSLILYLSPYPAGATTPIKIAIAYDLGGRGDHGINDSAAKGVDTVKKKFKLTFLSVREMVTNGLESDRESRLQFLASAHYNLVIAVGADYAQAVKIVALANPSTQFALINDASIGDLNISDMVFSNPDGAYLAGVLAGAATKRNKIGFVAPNNLAINFIYFKRGIASVNPKAIALGQSMEGTPASATQALVSQGVDVIFSLWSSTSEVQDSVAARSTAKRPLYFIGVSPDQYFLQEKNTQKILLGAVSKHIDIAVADVMVAALRQETVIDTLDAARGFYGHMYTVKDGGVSMALTNLGAKYSVKIATAIAALKSGKVKLS